MKGKDQVRGSVAGSERVSLRIELGRTVRVLSFLCAYIDFNPCLWRLLKVCLVGGLLERRLTIVNACQSCCSCHLCPTRRDCLFLLITQLALGTPKCFVQSLVHARPSPPFSIISIRAPLSSRAKQSKSCCVHPHRVQRYLMHVAREIHDFMMQLWNWTVPAKKQQIRTLYRQYLSADEIVPFHSVYLTICCRRNMTKFKYF